MSVDELKQFLVGLPAALDYIVPSGVNHNVFRALYYCATNKGQCLSTILPSVPLPEIEKIQLQGLNFAFSLSDENKLFYRNSRRSASNASHYSHPRGKVCARSFRSKEPVYRCEECGFDNTCVLCFHCFNKDDHKGHNVTMYISEGNSGGVCDCGDPEAFVKELNCKCQMSQNNNDDNPMDLSAMESSLRETITVCLDYILDVLNYSVHALPFIHDNINKEGSKLTSAMLSDYSSLPKKAYGNAEDINSNDLWYLILWNDERHDFPQAQEAIILASGVSEEKAHKIATQINESGRGILREAKDPRNLVKSQKLAETEGLVATIISARDYMRDVIVGSILAWLADLSQFANNPTFSDMTRTILSDLLLAKGHQFAKPMPVSFFDTFSVNVERKAFENGLLLDNGEIVNGGLTKVKDDFEITHMERASHFVLEHKSSLDHGNIANSRFQYLLLFQIRMSKPMRELLPSVIIPPLIAELHKKVVCSQQFIEIYPSLITTLALSDREEDLNILSDISSQLFTCPKTVKSILRSGQVGNVIGPVSQLIEEHHSKWNFRTGYPNFIYIEDSSPERKFKSITKAVKWGIHDIGHLADKELASDSLYVFYERDTLVMLLLFLRNFQGYWPIKRKKGDHVEHEVFDFMVHLEYSIPVLNIAKSVATRSVDIALVNKAIALIVAFLELRKFDVNRDPNFRVSNDMVSFVNPINSFLSYMIQYQQPEFPRYIGEDRFWRISEISLRSIVLGSQVKVGLWIRNGNSVSRQASLYFDAILSDLTYLRDLHLNQVNLMTGDPTWALYNLLGAWELLDWYYGNDTHSTTVYQDRFNTISEKFIVFLYNMITDRSAFSRTSPEERRLANAGKAIAYALCDEPKSYSFLKSSIDSDISELPEFDDVLLEYTDYQAPSGLVDAGLYRLKPEIFEKLDPLSIFLDPSKFQVVTESLVKSIAKGKGVKEESVVLEPVFTETDIPFVKRDIGKFAKTKDFAKLIYKYLQVALDTSDETYLPQLLHLIHAILKDDENLNGPNYLNENFINIPIADLLLTIVESTMSKYVVNKADFLVDQFVVKDSRIIDNLIDCFGEEFMTSYKRKKTSLFETEAGKKKRLAEERKNKVMKKFAKRREKFLDKNKEFGQDSHIGTNDGSHGEHVSLRTCVLCGEEESSHSIFGILASVTDAATLWKIPVDDLHTDLAFRSWDSQSTMKAGQIYGKGYSGFSEDDSAFSKSRVMAQVFSTCGHGMHYDCYIRDSPGSQHYACPLCHNLQDIFVPTFLPPADGGGFSQAEIVRSELYSKYNKITSSVGLYKSKKIIESFVSDKYYGDKNFDVYGKILSEQLFHHTSDTRYLVGINNNEKFFNHIMKVNVLIADTIRMNEIASRLSGEKSLSNFLGQISGSVKTLIKTLIQCRAVMYECRSNSHLLGTSYDLQFEVNSFWNSDNLLDGIFNEVVTLFFQTDESITTLARLGLTKLVTIATFALIKRLNDPIHGENFKSYLISTPLELNSQTSDALVILLGNVVLDSGSDIDSNNKQLLVSIYCSLERLLLPYLRQMVILVDLLTSKNFGENTHESLPEFNNLESEVLKQTRIDSADALCHVLNLPTLDQIVASIAFEGNDLDYNVFDVVLSAKIPKYINSGILTLQYPAVVKLIELPEDYTSCITETYSDKRGYDRIICLSCGDLLKSTRFAFHMSECCSHTNVFFLPRLNVLRICTHIGHNRISIEIPAPYLTAHGEVKKKRVNGKATLNTYRYQYLNKLWLDQGLYGFVTRNLFGTRQSLDDLNIDVGRNDDAEDFYDDSDQLDDEVFGEVNSFIW
ncbi:ubiquitin-protein ligase E3 component N-recognin-1 (N-end-recognizing protein) [Scheffersomyces stipitis CBS 6054]|uniref:E3 ubiquitin-protein ligase n=1 Tax=Scheffersomyces stipitis (strain ATCC 58785 / CBS 6054 / NBRC 10063 / NRRL Y-11545) TaxID=322104 RepID=A3GGK8_PICST|nr:ubiquitin-protein ligase E3 component N-recognin-1 (N-end-recognizing protein) [Scheffersomyces stipitis CBS 6054]EAZ63950.2 ubiquitin-protein ligase E3 component N-recognin-1 (N-end-recognizing protein) [Scheffersomyces stipitis CBS 6054]KAG2735012.1 hypothetical protein G9P44_001226 [Scheffersomyces stipitis]